MDKFDLKKIIKPFLKKKVPLSKKTRNAKRDWIVLLGVMVVVLGAVVYFNIHLFSQVQSGALFTTETDDSKTKTIVDEELLGETLEAFRSREERFEEYKNTFPRVPSVN